MLVLCRIHVQFVEKISLESIDLGGAENLGCSLDLEFLEPVQMMSSIKH